MAKLRVGYIVDDGPQSEWVRDLVERSRSSAYYAIELLIVQQIPVVESGAIGKIVRHARRKGLIHLFESALFMALSRLEKASVMRQPRYEAHFRAHDLDAFAIPKLVVHPHASPSGLVYRYGAEDLAHIHAARLDVLVRGCRAILRGEILSVCPHGIVSFHHANNDVNRGGPPAFWEVYNREPSTGFVIQRLLDELDGGDVLMKGAISTSSLYVLNLVRLYRKAHVFMHKMLEDLGRTGRLPEPHRKLPYAYPLYTRPTLRHQSLYLARAASHVSGKIVNRLMGWTWRWGVAYQFVDDWRAAALWKSVAIDNPPHRFLADPFVAHKNGMSVCFVEDYDFRTQKGVITAFRIDRSGHKELGVALEEPFHLSYPYLFEADGTLFMCPETQASGEIRIYRCTDFPLKWRLHKILMRDVRAVDTNIFPHDGKWWMLTTIDTAGGIERSSELHLFHADSFDAEKWLAHPLNPIVFDSRRGRNGGMIHTQNGDLYRVFQAQGFDMYGESLGIAAITDLSQNSYHEEILTTIPPRFFPRIQGTHTLSFSGGLLAVDYVRREPAH